MNKKAVALIGTFTFGLVILVNTAFAQTVETFDPQWGLAQLTNTTLEKSMEKNSESVLLEDEVVENEAPASSPTVHKIQSGDTLTEIAKLYGVSVEELKEWNGLQSDYLYAEDQLAVAETAAGTVKPRTTSPVIKSLSGKTADTNTVSQQQVSNKITKKTTMIATAYTAFCEGCSGITANGTDLRANPGLKVIAVDPKVIPLGTHVWVEGYGEAIAADTGGAIKGNRIDLFMPSEDNANNWGRRTVTVEILN